MKFDVEARRFTSLKKMEPLAVTRYLLSLFAFAVLTRTIPAGAVDFDKFKSTGYDVSEKSMSQYLDEGFSIKALDGRDFVLANDEGKHVLCQLLAPLDPSLQDVFKGATAVSACYLLH